MDLLIFAALVIGVLVLKTRDQRQRIALLGSHLSRYDIEKLMEGLTEGYLRALGETQYLACTDSLAKGHDGAVVARMIVAFIEGAPSPV